MNWPGDCFCSLTLMLTLVVGSGCGPSSKLPRVPLQGRVLLDGRPVTSAAVQLSPAPGTSGPSATAEVRDGQFVFDRENGPVTGAYVAELIFSERKSPDSQTSLEEPPIAPTIPVSVPAQPPFELVLEFFHARNAPATGVVP